MEDGIGSGLGVFITGNSIIGYLNSFLSIEQEEWSRADSVVGGEAAVTHVC